MGTIIIPIIQIRKQTIWLSGLFKVIQLEIVAPAVNLGSSDAKIHVFRVVEKNSGYQWECRYVIIRLTPQLHATAQLHS